MEEVDNQGINSLGSYPRGKGQAKPLPTTPSVLGGLCSNLTRFIETFISSNKFIMEIYSMVNLMIVIVHHKYYNSIFYIFDQN